MGLGGFFLLVIVAAAAKAKRTFDPLGLELDKPRRRVPPPPPRAPPPRAAAPTVKIPQGRTDTSFPGPNWVIDAPPSDAAVARAAALVPVLWAEGEGTGAVEELGGKRQGFLATEMPDGSRGVTIWRLASGTVVRKVTPKPTPTVRRRKPKPKPKPKPKLEPKPVAVPPKPSAEPPVPPPPPPLPPPQTADEVELEPSPPPPPPPPVAVVRPVRADKPVLMQGSRGPAVEELQRALGIGGTLGFFGPMTVGKVREFQQANDLKVDGIVGPETWGALLA